MFVLVQHLFFFHEFLSRTFAHTQPDPKPDPLPTSTPNPTSDPLGGARDRQGLIHRYHLMFVLKREERWRRGREEVGGLSSGSCACFSSEDV